MNITIEQVKSALFTIVTGSSVLVTDVAELEYQGEGFGYPCIRYELDLCEPDDCGGYNVHFNIHCWSESSSSLEATQIMDDIVAAIDKTVVHTPIKLQTIRLIQIPRIVRQERLWKGVAYFKCAASA